MVPIDTTFLIGLMQGMLFTSSCYDTSKNVTLLAFTIARTKDRNNWLWVLQYCTEIFPHVRVLVSDGAKGLKFAGVKELLEEFSIPHTRFTWNIIQKNLPKSGIRYSNIEKQALCAASQSRTLAHANTVQHNADMLYELCR